MKTASRIACAACGTTSLVLCDATAQTAPCPKCLQPVERDHLELALAWKRRIERAAAMSEVMARHPQRDRHAGKSTRGNA
jgi:hypothetical protein